jgi:diketogulonate reductase-like aldo/keto reductase
MSRQAVRNAMVRSLVRLGRIDLYQIHYPIATIPIEETMTALIQGVTDGLVESLGVCNFSLDQFYSAQKVYPGGLVSNQLRAAPDDCQRLIHLLPYYEQAAVDLIGHSPFGQEGSSAPNLSLAALVTAGIIPIPGTNNVEHLKANLQCMIS